MAPNLFGNNLVLAAGTIEPEGTVKSATQEPIITTASSTDKINQTKANEATAAAVIAAATVEKPYRVQLVWRNVIAFIYLHAAAFYGIYLMFTSAKASTNIFSIFLGILGALGVTAGAHRLWAHKAYKAKWPLRLFLMILQTFAFQNCIHEWVRDHRVHHKFTDTNADPHNASRGFFFSHMGWLVVKKHPDVKRKGACIDMSDIEQDQIVMFQKKHYAYMMPILCFLIPAFLPYYFLGDTISNGWYITSIFRYVLSLHGTWFVNSAAHIWGMKPYDKNIKPTNNLFVGLIAIGEGWHNYHHVFPWDYKAAELGNYRTNLTTAFIDGCSRLGLAYDLKYVSDDVIRKRILRTGDGSHKYSQTKRDEEIQKLLCDEHEHHNSDQTMIWGWDDVEMSEEDKKYATIYNKKQE